MKIWDSVYVYLHNFITEHKAKLCLNPLSTSTNSRYMPLLKAKLFYLKLNLFSKLTNDTFKTGYKKISLKLW